MPGSSNRATALRMLNRPIPIDCPVRLIHGDKDEEVPVGVAFKLLEDAPFRRCPADHHQMGRSPAVEAARDRDASCARSPCWRRKSHDPDRLPLARRRARRRATCPSRLRSAAQKAICRAVAAPAGGRVRRGRGRVRDRRRHARSRATRPPTACWPRPAICGSPPASRARRRWRSTGRWPAPACWPTSAARPCSTAPAPPKRRATSKPRAPRSPSRGRRRSATIPSSGISRPRWRSARMTPPPPSSAIGRALALAPNDPTVLFEAGHVFHFAGDDASARDYWSRAAAADPKGQRRRRAARAGDARTCR